MSKGKNLVFYYIKQMKKFFFFGGYYTLIFMYNAHHNPDEMELVFTENLNNQNEIWSEVKIFLIYGYK